MCVHLNKPGMHREPPCDPEFAPPEIPPCSNQLRHADTPSAALGAAPAITSGSIFSPSIHADTGISLLDLPDVEPDDSEGQTLLPLDRSRSASPAPRDFLGVTSQTVTDPMELADIRASSLGGPGTSPAIFGSQPSLDWSDFLGFGMSPSALMTADPTVLLVTPVEDSPVCQPFLGSPTPAPGTLSSAPVTVVQTAVISQPLGADNSAANEPPLVTLTQPFLASPSPPIKCEPGEIIIINSPERTQSPHLNRQSTLFGQRCVT